MKTKLVKMYLIGIRYSPPPPPTHTHTYTHLLILPTLDRLCTDFVELQRQIFVFHLSFDDFFYIQIQFKIHLQVNPSPS